MTGEEYIVFCGGNQLSNQLCNQVSNQESNGVRSVLKNEIGDRAEDILTLLSGGPHSSAEILESIGISKQTKNRNKHIDPLLSLGWLEYTIPENVRDRNQKYKLSVAGKKVLQLIKSEIK